MTLGNLARAYAVQGDASNAVRYMARVNAATETNLSLNLAIGSEHDRLAYADKFSYQTSRAISLNISEAPHDPAAVDLAAQMILQRKGRVLDAVADNMTALRRRLEPEDQKLLNELSLTIAELAKAAMHGPGQTPLEESSWVATRLAKAGTTFILRPFPAPLWKLVSSKHCFPMQRFSPDRRPAKQNLNGWSHQPSCT
jgi:hypothetical protein